MTDIVRIILFSAVFCLACGVLCQAAAEPKAVSQSQSRQQKAETLRGVGQNWIQVGLEQYKRGLYTEAEKSFLAATEYQEYLTDKENKQLEDNLTKARQAIVERQAATEQIKQAQDLQNKGQTLEAKAHYEKIRNSPYLTEQQRREIDTELKGINEKLERKKEKITDLYNRSVELYKAGNLEEARNGFVEAAKYGLLVTPKGKSPEDYLLKIDKTLTDRLKSSLSPEPKPTQTPPTPAQPAETEKTPPVASPAPQQSETELLQPAPEQKPPEKEQPEEPQPQTSEELTEVAAPSESTSQEQQQPETATAEAAPAEEEAKIKIARSYTKAFVEDTAVKVGFYIGKGELDRAVAAVRKATDVVSENRSLLGDELFTQYTVRLKRLADRIIQARKTP